MPHFQLFTLHSSAYWTGQGSWAQEASGRTLWSTVKGQNRGSCFPQLRKLGLGVSRGRTLSGLLKMFLRKPKLVRARLVVKVDCRKLPLDFKLHFVNARLRNLFCCHHNFPRRASIQSFARYVSRAACHEVVGVATSFRDKL